MKTFVSIAQQMLNGEITTDQAAEEMTQLEPAKAYSDYDGVYYEGERRNTVRAMKALSIDKDTGKINLQIDQRIEELIDVFLEKEETD